LITSLVAALNGSVCSILEVALCHVSAIGDLNVFGEGADDGLPQARRGGAAERKVVSAERLDVIGVFQGADQQALQRMLIRAGAHALDIGR
jgi:hypothetical protein